MAASAGMAAPAAILVALQVVLGEIVGVVVARGGDVAAGTARAPIPSPTGDFRIDYHGGFHEKISRGPIRQSLLGAR